MREGTHCYWLDWPLLDAAVKSANSLSSGAHDQECFYQLNAVVMKAGGLGA